MLNDVAANNGSVAAVNMNSYIIAVLVIFYLQLNHKLPTVTDLASTIAQGMKVSAKNSFGQLVKGFFSFYGKIFDAKSHLISANVGKWQQKRQGGQKHFTAAQKRFLL